MSATTTATAVHLKNIVFLSDFTEASDRALGYAAALARHYQANLHFCHLVQRSDPILPPYHSIFIPESEVVSILKQQQRAAQELALQELLKSELAGLAREAVVRVGSPALLTELLPEFDADLVVLATTGKHGWKKFFLGSFAQQVLHFVDRPVLTIGPGSRKAWSRDIDLQRILYATDFSDEAAKALPYALGLARDYHARITFLHVERKDGGEHEIQRQLAVNAYTQLMETLLPTEYVLTPKPEFAVVFGKPAEQILQVAADRDSDLIVMGARGSGFMSRLAGTLLGGTAYDVVTRAAGPVLTVRAPDRN